MVLGAHMWGRELQRLVDPRLSRRVALLSLLGMTFRLSAPLTAWALFSAAVGMKFALAIVLGALFSLRSLLARLFEVRTEAELGETVVQSLVDGDVLNPQILVKEDPHVTIAQGVFLSAQALMQFLPSLIADSIAAMLFVAVGVAVAPTRLLLLSAALALPATLSLLLARRRLARVVQQAWTLRERFFENVTDVIDGRIEIAAAGQRDAFLVDTALRASEWRTAAFRVTGTALISGRLPVGIFAAAVAALVLFGSRTHMLVVTWSQIAIYASVLPTFAGIAQGVHGLVQARPWLSSVTTLLEQRQPRRTGGSVGSDPCSIDLEDVSFRYRGSAVDALAGLSVRTGDRGVVALTGANGSGKSTCLRLLLGLASPTSGVVRIAGMPSTEVDLEWWHTQVTYLPQRPYLPWRSDIRGAVHLLVPHADDDTIYQALGRVGLLGSLLSGGSDPLAVSVATLSVGQRQRVALARLLCNHQAKVFILDEPDANLDREGIEMVVKLVRELASKRRVILAAHTGELLGCADRVIELNGGRVVGDQLRSQP